MGIFARLFGQGNVLDMLDDYRTAMQAVRVISEMPDAEAVRLLTDGLQRHRSSRVRAECINILLHPAYNLGESTLRAIVEALNDADRQVRINTTIAIRRIVDAQKVVMA